MIVLAIAIDSFAGAFATSLISLNKKIRRAMTVDGILMGWGISL